MEGMMFVGIPGPGEWFKRIKSDTNCYNLLYILSLLFVIPSEDSATAKCSLAIQGSLCDVCVMKIHLMIIVSQEQDLTVTTQHNRY